MSRGSTFSLPPLEKESRAASSGGSQADALRLYHALMEKFEDQKKELSNRAMTIKTLQRNFEKISVLCKQQSQSLEAANIRAEQAEEKARDLQDTIEAYKERVTDLERKAPSEEHMKEVKRLEEALKSAKASVGTAASEALQAAKAAQAGKAEKLATELRKMRTRCSDMEKRLRQQQAEQDKLELDLLKHVELNKALQTELQAAHETLDAMKAARQDSARSTANAEAEEVRKLKKELERLYKEIGDKSRHLQLSEEGSQKELETLRNTAEVVEMKLKGENSTLMKKIESLKSSLSKLAGSEDGLKSQLEQKDVELKSLKEQLENEVSGKSKLLIEKQSLSESLQLSLQMEQSLKDLNVKLSSEIQKQKEEVEQLKKSAQLLRQEHNHLDETLKDRTTEIAMIKAKLDEAERAREEASSQLLSARSSSCQELERIAEMKEEKEKKLKQAEDGIRLLKEQLAERENLLAQERQEKASLSTELLTARGTVEEVKADAEKLLASKENDLQTLRTDLEKMVSESHGMQRRAISVAEEIQEERRQRELLEAQLNTGEKERAAQRELLEAQLDAVEKEKAALKDLLQAKTSELDEKQRDEEKLRQEKETLEEKVCDLRAAMETNSVISELKVVVRKLKKNEDATEANTTCYSCLNMLRSPVVLVANGQNACRECAEAKIVNGEVRLPSDDVAGVDPRPHERQRLSEQGYVLADGLDDLCAKIVYRKQAVDALVAMVQKWES